LLRLKIVHPHYFDRGKFEIDEIFRKACRITGFSKYVYQPDPKNPKVLTDEDLDFFIADAVLDDKIAGKVEVVPLVTSFFMKRGNSSRRFPKVSGL